VALSSLWCKAALSRTDNFRARTEDTAIITEAKRVFVYPGIEQKKLYRPEYIMLLETGLSMIKRSCENFIFTTLYEPYLPKRDENIARHEKFKKDIHYFGFSHIDFNVRWKVPNSRKWYKEQAILLGIRKVSHWTGGYFIGRQCINNFISLQNTFQIGLTKDELLLIGKKMTIKSSFLLKTDDSENAVMFCDGSIKDMGLFTPDVIFNFYNDLRGQTVQFLSVGENNFGNESCRGSMFIQACMEPFRRKFLAELAERPTVETC
jgi:hypothetical protein